VHGPVAERRAINSGVGVKKVGRRVAYPADGRTTSYVMLDGAVDGAAGGKSSKDALSIEVEENWRSQAVLSPEHPR
jgi:hypothetical protein